MGRRLLIEQRERWHNQPGKSSRLIGNNQWQGQRLLRFAPTHTYRLIRIAGDERLLTRVSALPFDPTRLPAHARLGSPQHHSCSR